MSGNTTETYGPDSLERGARTRRVSLVALYTPDQDHVDSSWRINDQVTLGRSDDAGITLDDHKLSRQHMRIQQVGTDGFEVLDLDSKNGVFLEGVPVKVAPLQHGSVIRAGQSVFLFSTDGRPDFDAAADPMLVGYSAPLWRALFRAREALTQGHDLVVTGAPGSGRTTLAQRAWQLAYEDAPLRVLTAPPESPLDGAMLVRDIDTWSAKARAALSAYCKAHPKGHSLSTCQQVPKEVMGRRSVKVANPSLSERRRDVLTLAKHFAASHDIALGASISEALLISSWPGEITALQEVVASLHPSTGSASGLNTLQTKLSQRRNLFTSATQDEGVVQERWLANVDPEQHALVFDDVHQRRARFANQTRWDGLAKRTPMRLLLSALVRHRAHHPGDVIDAHDAIEFAWPDEKILPDAARNRLYRTIWALRQLGLGDALEQYEGGYRLQPALPILHLGTRR